MNPCTTCGNVYDKSFRIITHAGEELSFDSFECAIHHLAPRCNHCGCVIIGHGSEAADGTFFCSAHCAQHAGIETLQDREDKK